MALPALLWLRGTSAHFMCFARLRRSTSSPNPVSPFCVCCVFSEFINIQQSKHRRYLMNSSLCNYCTENQIQDFLLSLHLTGTLTHSPKAELALLYGLANHAEEHYERVLLPKKDGSKRILHVPDSVLKHVQKQILRQVLMEIPVSSYSCAYQKGSSLSQNAAP